MGDIPIDRFGDEIRWKKRSLRMQEFPKIRAYLDDCLEDGTRSEPGLPATSDLQLLLDAVLALKPVLVKDQATWVRSGGQRKPLQEQQAHVSKHKVMNHALERIEKEILRRMAIPEISVEVVSWELLPEGEGLGAAVNAYIRKTQTKYKARRFDGSRLEKLMTLTPVRCAVGREEFDGYMAFFFAGCDQAVLECGWEGNALYIFPENKWASLSKFTKSELIESHRDELTRLTHGKDQLWFQRLKSVINPKTSRFTTAKRPGRPTETRASAAKKKTTNKAAKKKGKANGWGELPQI